MTDAVPLTETWTIPQLTAWVNGLLRESLGEEIWIEGEISNLQRSAAGHVYFTLVEPAPAAAPTDTKRRPPAQQTLSVTLFDWHRQNVNRQLTQTGGGVRMSDGVRVRIRGSVEIYGARSQIQLKMSGIDPVFTLGTMAAERAQLMANLRRDGLLDLNKTMPLGPLPTRIAVITSLVSAARADFQHELERSELGFDLLIIDARVQGNEAEASLLAAMASAVAAEVELIALVRGGGARTDLAAFDLESIARAVALCPVPVWVGLGHETDRSVVDELAHRSFKTPTACAAGIAEHAGRGRETIYQLWEAIEDRAATLLLAETGRIDRIGTRIVSNARTSLVVASSRLGHAATTMALSAPRQLVDHDRRLTALGATLRAYDPSTTLARGFSITRLADGTLARAATVQPGQALRTVVADGVIDSTATGSVASEP